MGWLDLAKGFVEANYWRSEFVGAGLENYWRKAGSGPIQGRSRILKHTQIAPEKQEVEDLCNLFSDSFFGGYVLFIFILQFDPKFDPLVFKQAVPSNVVPQKDAPERQECWFCLW